MRVRLGTDPRIHITLLLLFSALAYLPFLGARDLWAPVEPRYAEITRVMWEKGEWIVPRVNGEPYADKPILFFWLALIFSKISGGPSELSIRLPSALAGMGLVLATYSLVSNFFGKERALLSSIVLASSLRVIWEARWAHTDVVVAFFITLAMLFFLKAFFGRGTARHYYLAYAMMGLATLAKGLIGFLLPGLVIFIYIALTGSWRKLREMRLPTGTVVFLVIVLPWFISVTREVGTSYLIDFVWTQHFQRYLQPQGHEEPFYYYFLNLPADLLPWTLYLPGTIAYYGKKKNEILKGEPLFFLLWIVVIFVFFNFTTQKRSLYLLPIFPPLSALLAGYLEALLKPNPPPLARFTCGANLSFFGLLILVAVLAPLIAGKTPLNDAVSFLPFSLFLFSASMFTVYLFFRKRWLPAYFASALTMAGIFVTLYGWIFPYFNPLVSPKSIGMSVRRIVPAESPLWIYKDTMTDINFYARRERIPILLGKNDLKKRMKETGIAYLLIKERERRELEGSSAYRAELMAEGAPRGKRWRLLKLTSLSDDAKDNSH